MSGRGRQTSQKQPINAGKCWTGAGLGHSSQGSRMGSRSRALASEAVKPDIRSDPQGEMPWSERPPDGTGGNLAVAFGRAG